MTFTPFRLSHGGSPTAAKTAIPAKALTARSAAFSTFATFATGTRRETTCEAFAESARTIDEGAKVPCEWAEGWARLEAMPTPAGVDPAQWRAVIKAAARFLDKWGANAAALGWTAGELFGLDPSAPLNRRDRRGAAFLLVDVEVLAVTAEAITLLNGRNVLRLYRRAGQYVPAWETLNASGI